MLVSTTSPDLINKVVEIKVNDVLFSIRIMEDMFCEISNRSTSDWKCSASDGFSSADEESLAGSVLAVPETVFEEGIRDEDLQRLYFKFSNPNFGRLTSIEEMQRGPINQSRVAEKYNRAAFPLTKNCSNRRGEDNNGSNLSVSKTKEAIGESPTKLV